MKNTVKKTMLLLLFVFVCKLHCQNADAQIDYITPNDIINLNKSSKYKKTAIKEEFRLLMEAAKNNFPNNNSTNSNPTYRREASLLQSICFYEMKEYKADILVLQEKHKELFLIEEKHRQDYLKANPGIRVKFPSNYHKIYIYIENYIIPYLEGGTKKDFLYKNQRGDMLFLTNEELNNCFKNQM